MKIQTLRQMLVHLHYPHKSMRDVELSLSYDLLRNDFARCSMSAMPGLVLSLGLPPGLNGAVNTIASVLAVFGARNMP